jgi:hypothetical protein
MIRLNFCWFPMFFFNREASFKIDYLVHAIGKMDLARIVLLRAAEIFIPFKRLSNSWRRRSTRHPLTTILYSYSIDSCLIGIVLLTKMWQFIFLFVMLCLTSDV